MKRILIALAVSALTVAVVYLAFCWGAVSA